jgi:uncharacterized protein (TIGR03000 family)
MTMSKTLWTIALVGAALLVIPSVSEAQRFGRGWGGGRWGGGWGRDGAVSVGIGSPGYYGGYSGYGYGWNRPYYGGYTYGYPTYSYPSYGYGYSYPAYSDQGFVNNPQVTFAGDNQLGNQQFGLNNAQSSFYPGFAQSGMMNPNDAGIIVRVPDPNAEIFFGDHQTQQRGIIRHFETDQPLQPNQSYTFQVRARWTQNGQPVEQTRQVQARAGQNVTVDFAGPNAGPMPNVQQQFYPQQFPNNTQGQFQGQQLQNQNLNNPNLQNQNRNPNAPEPNNPAANPNQTAPNQPAPNQQNRNERLPNPPTQTPPSQQTPTNAPQ